MKIRLTLRAVAELQAIGEYLHRENPEAARKAEAAIVAAFETLRLFPEAGRLQDVAHVRKFTTRRYGYLIYYRALRSRNEILILTILHGRRHRALNDA